MAHLLINLEVDFADDVDDEDIDIALDDLKDTIKNTTFLASEEITTDGGYPYTVAKLTVGVVDSDEV